MQITDFLDGFNGGNRTNRFVVEFKTGTLGPVVEATAGDDQGLAGNAKSVFANRSYATKDGYAGFHIHVRATRIPELNIGTIPVNYRGKTILFPGDRQLANWEIIVLDDMSDTPGNEANYNSHLHRAFMDWSNAIVPTDSRLGVQDFYGATNYPGSTWRISQLDSWPVTATSGISAPNTVRKFNMYNCWPKEVGPLQLDMASDNSINSFRVVMAYSHTDGWDNTNAAGSWDGTSII